MQKFQITNSEQMQAINKEDIDDSIRTRSDFSICLNQTDLSHKAESILIFGGKSISNQSKDIWHNDLYNFNLTNKQISKLKTKSDPAKKKLFEPPGMSGHRSWLQGRYFYAFGG